MNPGGFLEQVRKRKFLQTQTQEAEAGRWALEANLSYLLRTCLQIRLTARHRGEAQDWMEQRASATEAQREACGGSHWGLPHQRTGMRLLLVSSPV